MVPLQADALRIDGLIQHVRRLGHLEDRDHIKRTGVVNIGVLPGLAVRLSVISQASEVQPSPELTLACM